MPSRAALFASIVESSPDAIFTEDLAGRITTWNAAAERLFGHTAAEMLGNSRAVLGVLNTPCDQPQRYQTVLTTKTGEPLALEVTVSPTRGAKGEPSGFSTVVRPHPQDHYAAAIEGSPVVVFAHDADLRYTWIRNPAVLFAPDLLIGLTDFEVFERPEDAARIVAIKRSVLESGIARREEVPFLDRGSIHWYDLHVKPQWTGGKISGLLCTASDVTEPKLREQRHKEHLELTLQRFEATIESSMVVAFTQDLNLRYTWLRNPAVGFLDAGLIGRTEYEVFERPEDAARILAIKQSVLRSGHIRPVIDIRASCLEGQCVISIQDNGRGFEEHYSAYIFEPFKRLENHLTSGTGLGLAICRRIVERRGGRIWAAGQPGVGATFSFSLPGEFT